MKRCNHKQFKLVSILVLGVLGGISNNLAWADAYTFRNETDWEIFFHENSHHDSDDGGGPVRHWSLGGKNSGNSSRNFTLKGTAEEGHGYKGWEMYGKEPGTGICYDLADITLHIGRSKKVPNGYTYDEGVMTSADWWRRTAPFLVVLPKYEKDESPYSAYKTYILGFDSRNYSFTIPDATTSPNRLDGYYFSAVQFTNIDLPIIFAITNKYYPFSRNHRVDDKNCRV